MHIPSAAAADPGSPSGFQVPAESAALGRLAAVTAELAAAEALESVVPIVVSHVRDAVHAAVSTLMVVDGGLLRIIAQQGVAPDRARRWSSFSIEDQNPASESARTRRPVIVSDADEVRRRYPHMAPDTPPQRSVVCLPLIAVGEVIGVIGLTFEHNWEPGSPELAFLMTFADTCAQAIRRARAMEEAATHADRLGFLARASGELASSLDYRTTLSNVARAAVPTLGTWCAVDLLVDDQLTTLAVAHADPDKAAWAWRLRERYPVDMHAETGAPNVVRTGRSELYPRITDEMLVAAARDDEHLRLSRQLQLRSVLIAPLLARGRPLGAITLIRTADEPPFTPTDLSLAEDLGARAGVAIDNARLHNDTVNVALQLQRAVLPEHLDQLSGWETAAHYRPDGNAQVGGDFYDSVGLPDGRLAVFIGDVMGHGIKAAAAMAQIRAAVRALLTDDPEPEVVTARLDRMFLQLGVSSLVTLLYAVISPDGAIRYVNAGHPPPLQRTRTSARFLAAASRPPLGIGSTNAVAVALHMQPGHTLLLYTDGLIERRGEALDAGLDRLREHSAALDHPTLTTGLTNLTRLMASEDHDDIAAVAIRYGSPAG